MKDEMNQTPDLTTQQGFSRRKFLGYAGGIAGAGLLIASCKKEEGNVQPEPGAIDLGTNDTGLLNLMFVTQQMEADFYSLVVDNPFVGMTNEQKKLFVDIRDHEIAHREFLRNYLDGKGPVVTSDFSSVNFTDAPSVLQVAELLENTVVASFNDIARLFGFGDNVAIVVKMASVEARHAATITNMISQDRYFNTLDASNAEQGMLPSNTVITINKYLSTKVSGNNLPNT